MAAIVFVNEWTPTTVALNGKSVIRNFINTTKVSLYNAPYKYDAEFIYKTSYPRCPFFIFLHTHSHTHTHTKDLVHFFAVNLSTNLYQTPLMSEPSTRQTSAFIVGPKTTIWLWCQHSLSAATLSTLETMT